MQTLIYNLLKPFRKLRVFLTKQRSHFEAQLDIDYLNKYKASELRFDQKAAQAKLEDLEKQIQREHERPGKNNNQDKVNRLYAEASKIKQQISDSQSIRNVFDKTKALQGELEEYMQMFRK